MLASLQRTRQSNRQSAHRCRNVRVDIGMSRFYDLTKRIGREYEECLASASPTIVRFEETRRVVCTE